jgi:hypothetical protein
VKKIRKFVDSGFVKKHVMNLSLVHEMFGQSENCGLLSANIPKRYIKLGTTGKAVPGVKTKIIERNDEVLKTPMLDGGFAPEIGGVSFFVTSLTSLNYFCIFC